MAPKTIHTLSVEAILFDMDGTLIDSTPGVYAAWKTFATDYSLGDSTIIADTTHGRRLWDTLREICKIDDDVKLTAEVDRFEDEVIAGGPVALPGAIELLTKLNAEGVKWTIVTSASNNYTPKALERAGIPLPKAGLITANDVTRGKPHPDPYQAGAALLGVKPEDCLVVEDAISGITAGVAAGSRVLAVCTSTSPERLVASGVVPDVIAPDLLAVKVTAADGMVHVEI